MSTNNCAQFNPEVETVVEFMERLKVQCSEQIEKAGNDGRKKAAILVKALPVSVITDLQRRIKPTLLSAASYNELEEKLKLQFQIKKSIVGASVKFLNRKQAAGETIENYARSINDLASLCSYNDCCRDRLLRDTFVSGLRSSAILTGLLQTCETLNFNDCVEKAKLLEQLSADAEDIKLEPNMHSNYKMSDMGDIPKGYKCIRCGAVEKHLAKQCYALKSKCNTCGKVGHFSKMCKSRGNNHRNHAVCEDTASRSTCGAGFCGGSGVEDSRSTGCSYTAARRGADHRPCAPPPMCTDRHYSDAGCHVHNNEVSSCNCEEQVFY